MRILKSIVILFAVFVAASSSVFACGCGGSSGQTFESAVADAFNSSTAVFQGKVVGFEYRKGILNEFMAEMLDGSGQPIEYETMVVRFKVNRWWKGDLGQEIVLVTGKTKNSDGTASSNSCEFPFNDGESYLVFAHLDGASAMPRTTNCSLTRLSKDSKDVIKMLGKGIRPKSRPSPIYSH